MRFCHSTNATADRDVGLAVADRPRGPGKKGLIGEGETIPRLRERIAAIFVRASKAKAGTIARTEASRAVHAASLMSAARSGVVAGKKWLLSAHSCPLCHKIAGEVESMPLEASFGTVGTNPAYSTVAHPPAHPNCRCSLLFDLAEGSAPTVAAAVPAHVAGPEPTAPGLSPARSRPSHRLRSRPSTARTPPRSGSARDDPARPTRKLNGWGKDRWAAWAKSTTDPERQAIKYYMKDGYKVINARLRAGPLGDAADAVSRIDSALAKGKVPEDVVVYRGIPSASKLGLGGGEASVGAIIHDDGFMSVSLHGDATSRFSGRDGAILRFTLPGGTPGAYLAAAGQLDGITAGEAEILLPRGCTLRIVGADRTKSGKPIYDCVIEVAADEP